MLLQVKELNVYYGNIAYLEDINFYIKKGEIFSIVGESGSGKTLTGLSLINLLPDNFQIKGEILFEERDILKLSFNDLQKIRGRKISIIFQDPTTSINPVIKVGEQVAEMFVHHLKLSKKEAIEKTASIFENLKILHTLNCYPHQLSGGMRQRVMIAMSISCNPELIIADEPTTALDVTVQEEILDLLYYLVKNQEKSMILISHDMNIIAEYADRVMVMYAGRVLEEGKVEDVYKNPVHPYTKALLECIPSGKGGIKGIPGSIPSMKSLPMGCIFNPRCENKKQLCLKGSPKYIKVNEDHYVRCFLL